MNTKIIKLDINRRLYDKIVAKQDDTKSRFLLFQLLDGAVPFNLTDRSVRVYGVKPDGAVIFNDLTVTHSTTGFCLLELTNQMLAIAGTVKLELMITEGDKKLTSIPFEMEVIKKINSNAAVESSNEFRSLLNALKEIDDWNREFADKSGKLEELYTPRLNELGSQLDTNITKSYTKTNYSNSISRNGAISNFIKKLIRGSGVKVTALGDSITDCGKVTSGVTGGASSPEKGWFSLLEKHMKDTYGYSLIDCTNRGVGGQRVSEAFKRIITEIIPFDYDIIFIELGTNDWNYGTSLEQFEIDYRNLISELVKTTRADLLCVGLGWFKDYTTQYSIAKEWEYNQIIRKVALEFNIGYIDTRNAMMTSKYAWEDIVMKKDPVHPNDLGHQIWCDEALTWIDFQGYLIESDFRNNNFEYYLDSSYFRSNKGVSIDVNENYYFGTSAYINNSNNDSEIYLRFFGSDIKLIYTKASNYGKCKIYVDGGKNVIDEIDCYNDNISFNNIREIKNLNLGWHFICIIVEDKNVDSSGYSVNLEGVLIKNIMKSEQLSFTDQEIKKFNTVFYEEPFPQVTCYGNGYALINNISNRTIRIDTNPVGQIGYCSVKGF